MTLLLMSFYKLEDLTYSNSLNTKYTTLNSKINCHFLVISFHFNILLIKSYFQIHFKINHFKISKRVKMATESVNRVRRK